MIILANFLLILLIPATLMAMMSLRELQRVSGPDVMGPAFFFVAAGVVHCILAAIALALMVACDRFDGLVPTSGLQILVVLAGFALIDVGAAFAIYGSSSKNIADTEWWRSLGQAIGFALPSATILLLLVRANVSAPHSYGTRTAFLALILVAAFAWPTYYSIRKRTDAEKQRQINEYWDRQRRLIERGTAELAALPADAPLEKFLPYFADDSWPMDVRAAARLRIDPRPNLDDELRALLAGPNRDLALSYVCQLPETPMTLAQALFDALMQQAAEWRQHGGGSSTLSEDQATKLRRQCEQASGLAYTFREDAVDFRPLAAAWQDAVNAVSPQDSPNVQSAQSTLMFWKDRLQREQAAKPADTSPSSPSSGTPGEGRGGGSTNPASIQSNESNEPPP
jgi:hypothetical protein